MARDVYVAIADPVRRQILDLLNEREVVAAGDIASHIGRVSRPAVSRHLRVLRECGVVTSFRRGKTQNYALNPAPINAVRDGWLQSFAKKQAQSLRSLRAIAESDAPNETF